MTTVSRWSVVGLLVLLSIGGTTLVRAETSPGSLLDMLACVPQEAVSTGSGWATVRFADYEALFQGEGVSLLRSLGSVDLLMSTVPLGGMMSRIIAGPEALSYVLVASGRMQHLVGFEWLLDVDRSLEFGDPPDLGLILGGSFDTEVVGAALQSRGFALDDFDGVPIWYRLDDFAVSLPAREPADPFGGNIGAAARVARLPGMLANARSWQTIEAVVTAATSTGVSLADDPAYGALAAAVSEPEGLLIQALFFTGASLRRSAPEAGAKTTKDLDVLPEFSAAALADRQEGDDQVHLIALACSDVSAARTAAVVLASRIEAFCVPTHPGDILVERYGASVRSWVLEPSEDGVVLAVVEASYPLPNPRTDGETGRFLTAGLMYRAWVNAILCREFTPLW